MSSSAERLRIEVVDTTRDCGATGMRVDVFTLGAQARKLCGGIVNAEGVVDAPVLATEAVVPGEYEVVFHIAAYFRGRLAREDRPFLDTVRRAVGVRSRCPRTIKRPIKPDSASTSPHGRTPARRR